LGVVFAFSFKFGECVCAASSPLDVFDTSIAIDFYEAFANTFW